MNPSNSAADACETPSPVLRLDRLLRFDPWVSERYERERGAERVKMLRHHIYIGLVLYNTHDIATIFLTPDILWTAIVLRLFVVTPGSLLLTWLLNRVGPESREWLVTAGMVQAFTLPAFLVWLTNAPLGGYAFADILLCLVYGNMMLLRFREAIIFTSAAFVIAATAILTKDGLPDSLRVAFMVQLFTASVFTIYANYLTEAVRCGGYVEELRAILKSEASEAARNRFLDLSLTDALTSLPNRRSLDQTVERWSNEGAMFAVMMIDVDHFKLFNDTFGHSAGDDCLRSIATTLSNAETGTEHFIARFGGEEFTVVARDLSPLRATRLAKTLIEAVEAIGISLPGRFDGANVVTISAGIALKMGDLDVKTVFKLADDALYLAKRGGRNRFVLADPAVNLSAQLAPT